MWVWMEKWFSSLGRLGKFHQKYVQVRHIFWSGATGAVAASVPEKFSVVGDQDLLGPGTDA